jgi:hypothetical protein
MDAIAAEITTGSRRDRPRVGPYSRRLHRGAIGELFDGRSAEGRFVRALEAELVQHVGGDPTITQRLLIDRLIKIQLQLAAFDAKLASGKWTGHDQRTYGGLLNAFRLTARELGLKATAAKPPSLADIAAEIVAKRESTAA